MSLDEGLSIPRLIQIMGYKVVYKVDYKFHVDEENNWAWDVWEMSGYA